MDQQFKQKVINRAKKVLFRSKGTVAAAFKPGAASQFWKHYQKLVGAKQESGLNAEQPIKDFIIKALEQHASEFPALEKWLFERGNLKFFPTTGQYDWLDAHILYSLIRQTKPNVILEISPNYGYSTGVILQALNANKSGMCASFELLPGTQSFARANFKRANINAERLLWLEGDCFTNLKNITEQKKLSVDLLFMDSDHSFEFTKRYMRELWPLVRSGGLMHVHDVTANAQDNWPFTQWPDIEGEDVYLAEYLNREHIEPSHFNYTSSYFKDIQSKAVVEKIVGSPNYRGNFQPLSKERNYSFWMTK